jgi:glycosyltransferase involved in cell wall biosynthesis
MSKASILFLTNTYPDFDSSYRGIFIRKLGTGLVGAGYDISVVTPKIYRESHSYEEQNGVRVYRFPFFSGNAPLIRYKTPPYLRMLSYYAAGFLVSLCVVLRRRVGLIHVHWAIPIGLVGALCGALTRRPMVVTVHGSDHRMAAEQGGLLRKVFLFVCKRAKQVHCVSGPMKEEIARWGIDEAKITVFPMAVDGSFLSVGRSRGPSCREEGLTVVSNRNLHALYNVSSFVQAIPRVLEKDSRMRFVIAGEGPERERLERQVNDLKIGPFVSIMGAVPHAAMSGLLRDADIYVSTSTSDGTSVSLLEAMAAGAFPVVTNIDSNQRWISNGKNGFLVPVGDEAILAERIVEASKNRELREEARRMNLEIIEERAEERRNTMKTARIYEAAFR